VSFRLEHVNLCVADLGGMIKFITTAFPTFRLRGEGVPEVGERWAHVGDDHTYIALSEATSGPGPSRELYAGQPGINHIGFEVDDVEALRTRLAIAGYRESTFPNSHPHRKRIYFRDPEGNEWEFVEYHSEDPNERNDYDLPDA
jgi:catechol 2,3-dioxygenase-like lactoylglutathione lyase family enzyme